MQVQTHPIHQSWITYAITIGIIVVVLALRMRGMSKMRPLKLGALWIVPALYLAVAVFMFVQLPPTGWVAIASAVGVAIGAAVGWQRGKMMHIHVDPESHALNQKASPAAMMFLIVLIVVRAGARSVLGQESNVSPAMLTDPLIAFALGMFTVTRLEMYLRAKRLLEEARGRG
ncbi:MAG TPA: CcdC protein domain-containing protein [Sphingomicrobium sp.]|nr:CcdC protein domain-containing protein [Sphingomicrobium sp.]